MKVYLGCYTDEAHPNGLKVLELDELSGGMNVLGEYPVSNALYQALSADGGILYSGTGDGLASFRASDMELVDRVGIGNCVCHVAEMQDGRHVVWADYLGGAAGSVEVAEGKFSSLVRHQHSGAGPNLPRQDSAHCHQALPTPDGRSYCVVDLGLDQIVEYPSGRVFRTSPAGAGPRHLVFHPNGRLAFLVYELGNLVSSLSWSPSNGFALLDTLPTLREPDMDSIAAAIRLTPDMKRVVVSNRGENSLATYGFDESTGKLSFLSRTMLPGNWPRDFIFINDTLALVACERSGEVLAMRHDPSNGGFEMANALGGLYRPVALTPCRN